MRPILPRNLCLDVVFLRQWFEGDLWLRSSFLVYSVSYVDEVRIACITATMSPFVLEGLHSPVKWWGWCREAFEAAKALDRPVLVDVGAVWCHWCHVMDETTYSDPEVASFINNYFVAVKVDRDERPDVDRRLQEMAQLISGQAGWPLTVFMTPSGEVIWAATYLPPRDMGRTPGMLTILKAVLEAYREKRGDIAKFAEELKAEVATWHSPAPGEPEREVQLELLTALASSFDAEYGGFGGAPKFPPIAQLELLLMRYFYDGVGLYRKMAEATLDAMATGRGLRPSAGRLLPLLHRPDVAHTTLREAPHRQRRASSHLRRGLRPLPQTPLFKDSPGHSGLARRIHEKTQRRVLRKPRRRRGGGGGRLLPVGPRRA
jgi:Highly conserved protein containing a thioredoxin domain, COG1331